MNKITIIKATEKDYKEIAKIEKIANSKTYSARIKEKEIKNFINNDFVFLIKNGNVTVGLISFKVMQKKIAHCNGLFIYPKFRGKGLAKKAVSLLLKKMNKYSKVELAVHPQNNPALTLYLSFGFVIESWQNNYFGDGQPRLIMVKK